MSWNERELRKIKKEYQEKTDEELAEELGKTKWQVRRKRQNLGLKKSGASWSDDEIKKIKQEWETKTDQEIADEIGKTKWQVQRKRQNLGLKKSYATWTDAEISKIEQEWEAKTDGELANEMGKTKWQVQRKRQNLGLKKSVSKAGDDWSDEDIEWLKENYDGMSDKELSSKLDKSEYEIQQKRYQLDLKKDPQKGGYYSSEGNIESVTQLGDTTQITHSIGNGRKNVLKGKLGEMLADLLKRELADILELSLDDRWEFFGWRMDVVNPDYEIRTTFEGREPKTVVASRSDPPRIYTASDKDELRSTAERQYVLASKDLLKEFDSINPPSVDKKYYAVEYTGDTKRIEFEVPESTINDEREAERVTVELPVISDFRILAVEIKTTTSNARKELTEAQNRALDASAESEYLRFYTMKIPIDSENFSIPDEAIIELMRLG